VISHQISPISTFTSSSSQETTPTSHPHPQSLVVTNMVVNRMEAIITTRYAPLVLPQNLNAFPTGDYMKYLPKYNGEGDITVEEHLVEFYNFSDNFNIEHADVWMRLFL
jgi:hypothetical protein